MVTNMYKGYGSDRDDQFEIGQDNFEGQNYVSLAHDDVTAAVSRIAQTQIFINVSLSQNLRP
jgi:hypothetical protein